MGLSIRVRRRYGFARPAQEGRTLSRMVGVGTGWAGWTSSSAKVVGAVVELCEGPDV